MSAPAENLPSYYKEALDLLLEMNHKLKDMCNLTDDECYNLYKPSQLREQIDSKFILRSQLHAITRAPMRDEKTKNIICLAMGPDGKPVTEQMYNEESAKLFNEAKDQVNKEDDQLAVIIEDYCAQFRTMATQYGTTVGSIYALFNITDLETKKSFSPGPSTLEVEPGTVMNED